MRLIIYFVQGAGPYTAVIKQLEADIVAEQKKVVELIGVFTLCSLLPVNASCFRCRH